MGTAPDCLDEILAGGTLANGAPTAVLDWTGGAALRRRLPAGSVFAPPTGSGSRLPYLDRSIDVVAIAGGDAEIVAEATRVASRAVVRVDPNGGRVGLVRRIAADRPDPAPASVSIVIPAYNGVEHVVACLLALEETTPDGLDVEIIVVDDASDDDTFAAIGFCAARNPRIQPLRNAANLGFVGTCGVGAARAAHDVLVFLNQDTIPLPGWLPALVSTFRTHERVGAVGARLLFPDGRLQEAGGVVFNDGTGANFGRGLDPHDPLVSFVREVDYCSGAALATPRRLFEDLGGFDPRFAPAYYEDTDYCLRVWQRGLRVLVQPASCVVHDEGSAHGTDLASGGKRHQARNRHVFARKWAAVLANHPPPPRRYDLRTWHDLAIRDRPA